MKGTEKSKGKKMRKVNASTTSTTQLKQSRAMCTECEMYYDMDDGEGKWIECELCLNWFHAACVGVDEDTDEAHFVCDSCN